MSIRNTLPLLLSMAALVTAEDVKPTPKDQAATAATAEKTGSSPQPAQAAAKKFVLGCTASLYPCTDWPIDKIPETPAEVIRLPALPGVEPSFDAKTRLPNRLVESRLGVLDETRSYAVVFEGYFYAKESGRYGMTVQSDDPFQIFLEGKALPGGSSDYTVPFEKAEFLVFEKDKFGNQTTVNRWSGDFFQAKKFAPATGQIDVTGGRYYRTQIICRQRWAIETPGKDRKRTIMPEPDDVLRAKGAKFSAFVTPPSGESVPLKLYLPEP